VIRSPSDCLGLDIYASEDLSNTAKTQSAKPEALVSTHPTAAPAPLRNCAMASGGFRRLGANSPKCSPVLAWWTILVVNGKYSAGSNTAACGDGREWPRPAVSPTF